MNESGRGWFMTAALVGALLCVGCEAALCEEPCEDDSDCASDLDCFQSTDGGVCLPPTCGSCSRGCTYQKQLDSAQEAQCSYLECI
jgi:hypothetical protein